MDVVLVYPAQETLWKISFSAQSVAVLVQQHLDCIRTVQGWTPELPQFACRVLCTPRMGQIYGHVAWESQRGRGDNCMSCCHC